MLTTLSNVQAKTKNITELNIVINQNGKKFVKNVL